MTEQSRTWTPFYLLVLCVLFVLYSVNTSILRGNLIDDAFISLRYAHNLASGHGLVFNPGDRLEGYTNFLWVIFETIVIKLGLDPVPVLKLIGWLLGMATWGLLLHWGIPWFRKQPFLVFIPLIYLSMSGVFINYTMSGMETNFYGFIMLLGLYFLTQYPSDRRSLYATLCFLAAALTRPEGLFFAVFALTVQAYFAWRKQLTWSRWLIHAAIFLIPFFVYTIWRISYFGSVLPNTFYVRMGDKLNDYYYSWTQGFRYFGSFNREYYGIPVIAFLSVFMIKKYRGLLVCYLFMLLFHAVIILEGGDYMIFYRMYVPVMPVMLLLLGIASGLILEIIRMEHTRAGKIVIIIFHIFIAVMISVPWWPVSESLVDNADQNLHKVGKHYRTYRTFDRFTGDDILLGQWLRQNAPPGTYLAVGLAGAIPYYSRLRSIDVLGVTDAHIAHSRLKKDERSAAMVKPKKGGPKLMAPLPAHEKSDWYYIIKQQPDVIIVNNARYDLLSKAGYDEYTIPGLKRRYWAKTDLWPQAAPRIVVP